ncbi:MAG: pyroglutamyl-peptidase I [Gemella sp.]|nr:pyroglutamyl-peptidase I [Gemella sp.]
MKILVTGFDPFGGEKINPSWEVVKSLPEKVKGVSIKGIQLPTVFGKSAEVLFKEIDKFKPDVVVCIGQAGGRAGITPERIAINIDDARIADNGGNKPLDDVIREDGKSAYFSTLPIKAMVENMKELGIRAEVSNTAGTFVCNHIMYQVLYYVDKNYPYTKAGFIHIPFLPEQVQDKDLPSMKFDDMKKGIISCLETIIEYYEKDDIKVTGGKEF